MVIDESLAETQLQEGRLANLAPFVGMAVASFSHSWHLQTGKKLTKLKANKDQKITQDNKLLRKTILKLDLIDLKSFKVLI